MRLEQKVDGERHKCGGWHLGYRRHDWMKHGMEGKEGQKVVNLTKRMFL